MKAIAVTLATALFATVAYASCTYSTYTYKGRTYYCTTCCYGTGQFRTCDTTCT